MTAPGTTGEPARRPALAEKPGLIERVAARVESVVEPTIARVLGVPRIAMAHAVYSRFSASSGPILARGLAFVALFALVPALLVVLAITGMFVSDPARRAEIVAIVAEQIPPLAPVIDEVLGSISEIAATTGVIGLLLLVWSASSLVRALDGAFRVIFEDSGEGRTPLRDALAVAAVAGGMFAAAIVLIVATLPGPLGEILGAPSPQLRSLASFAGIVGLLVVAYRFVPRPRPGWRQLGLPALAAGLAIYLLTALFAFLGPLLFGSAQLYGAFGTLFLGLIWLGNVTQVLLLGAAWVAERDRRARWPPASPEPGVAART